MPRAAKARLRTSQLKISDSMPILHRHHQGFTLIEIMVVVTIIGVMTGIIAINVVGKDPQKELNKEAMRFKALIELAQEEALFSQQEIGVIVTEQGYRFARWSVPQDTSTTLTDTATDLTQADGDKAANAVLSTALGSGSDLPDPSWNLISNDNTFRDYELDEDYELVLEVDQEQIDLTGGIDTEKRENAKQASKILEEEEEQLKPSIYVMSSGELSPFVLEMTLRDNRDIMAKVSGDETGRIWIGDDEETAE